ncbi:zf-HC2 domain-containing protein [Brevibacillus humidisoli]|uniref:zf-HC2 domain-containing protein n=1 Tax=Brevibacillus humidisoli TaxID=2895522 RepID=UPI001E30F199|nr:zf-HC2 domain-containing protein [Brevibacillus humidisoli]UFJ39513.1 zf-HC2 domain-containing protein [Brevibacillus humidisoli]
MREQCDIVQDILPLYMDGALRQPTKDYVQRHLAECERCRAVKQEWEKLDKWQAGRSIGQEPLTISTEEARFIKEVKKWRRRSGLFFLLLIVLFSAVTWMLRTYLYEPIPADNPMQSVREVIHLVPLL